MHYVINYNAWSDINPFLKYGTIGFFNEHCSNYCPNYFTRVDYQKIKFK